MYRTRQGQPVPKARPADMRAYRIWFDPTLRRWCVAPAEGSSAQVLVIAEPPKLCEIDIQCHPDGSMTCMAELIADGAKLGTSASACKTAILRLRREFEQCIHVPVVGSLGHD